MFFPPTQTFALTSSRTLTDVNTNCQNQALFLVSEQILLSEELMRCERYRNVYFINILHQVTNQHTHAQNIIVFYMYCYTVCVCVHIIYCTIIIQVTSVGIHNSVFLASNLIYLCLLFIVCPLFLPTTTLQTTVNY